MIDSTLFRLDKLVVDQALAAHRTEAEYLIKTYGVLVNGKLVNKPGKKFSASIQIEKVVEKEDTVSVRSVILKKALSTFSTSVKHQVAVDIGAGKGGFTQVLLEFGAKQVYSIDKQTNLLDSSLKEKSEVVDLHGVQVRELTPAIIKDNIDFCAVDVDVSVTNVLPFIHRYLKAGATIIVVVKPQFEVDKKEVQKGEMKNAKLIPSVLQEVKKQAALSNLIFMDSMESPILGNHGNREFVLCFKKS